MKTKNELEAAVKRKEPCIEVQGDLAKKIAWVGKLSPGKIMALSSLLAAGISNPVTALPVSAVAKLTGGEIATIILASGMSVSMILSVLRGYSVESEIAQNRVRLIAK